MLTALPPVGVHAVPADFSAFEPDDDAISRSDIARTGAAEKSCPLTHSSWSDCDQGRDERSARERSEIAVRLRSQLAHAKVACLRPRNG